MKCGFSRALTLQTSQSSCRELGGKRRYLQSRGTLGKHSDLGLRMDPKGKNPTGPSRRRKIPFCNGNPTLPASAKLGGNRDTDGHRGVVLGSLLPSSLCLLAQRALLLDQFCSEAFGIAAQFGNAVRATAAHGAPS